MLKKEILLSMGTIHKRKKVLRLETSVPIMVEA
jgi:hypothetical protein